MNVEKYMTKEVVATSSGETISCVRNLMLKKDISRVLIIEDGPIGIVTKKDISWRLASESAPWRRRPIDSISIKRIMTTGLITISLGASIEEAAKLMIDNEISSLPVLEAGSLVGIITKTDLLKAFAENYPDKFKTRELMSKQVVTANRHHTLTHLIDLMMEKGAGRVVIVEGTKPVGIVTPSDMSFAELADPKRGMRRKEVLYVRKPTRGDRPSYRHIKTFLVTAEDLMTAELITVESGTDAAKTASIILKKGISSLPVVEDESLAGIITKTDLVKGMAKERR
jgi:CBS domain-containing protein